MGNKSRCRSSSLNGYFSPGSLEVSFAMNNRLNESMCTFLCICVVWQWLLPTAYPLEANFVDWPEVGSASECVKHCDGEDGIKLSATMGLHEAFGGWQDEQEPLSCKAPLRIWMFQDWLLSSGILVHKVWMKCSGKEMKNAWPNPCELLVPAGVVWGP